jgi:hypothetical protein
MWPGVFRSIELSLLLINLNLVKSRLFRTLSETDSHRKIFLLKKRPYHKQNRLEETII